MTNITITSIENSSENLYPSWDDWVKVAEGRALWILHSSHDSPTLKTFEKLSKVDYFKMLDNLVEDPNIEAVITTCMSSDGYVHATEITDNHGLNSWETILSKSNYERFTEVMDLNTQGPKYRIF